MNTATTKTDAGEVSAKTLTTRGSVKKHERRKDVVYKDDVVEVWTTENHPSKKAGVLKVLHKVHAANLAEKGMVTFVAPEGGSKPKGGRGKKEGE